MPAVRTTLSGIVTAEGAPLGGAYVQVRDGNGAFTGERRTGPDGTFTFYLVQGRWGLVVMAPRGRRDERVIELAAGDAAEVEIALD
jgi:hypothetical protein